MIEHRNITEQAVAYLKKHIESGEWTVGDKIPSENELTKTLGVSRASVRQAVSQLAGVGILESIHGKGTFLINNEVDERRISEQMITAEDCLNVEKVLEFRRIVESEACYMAAENADESFIQRLKEQLNIMIESKDDVARFVAADMAFHHEICRASGNPLIEKSMNKIFDENMKSHQLTRKTFGYRDGIHYHQLIIEAIEAGHAGNARICMYEHMQNGINRLRR